MGLVVTVIVALSKVKITFGRIEQIQRFKSPNSSIPGECYNFAFTLHFLNQTFP